MTDFARSTPIVLDDSVHDYLREQLGEEPPEETVQMNVLCGRSTLELRNRLATDLNWTQRKVTETALNLLDMALKQIEAG